MAAYYSWKPGWGDNPPLLKISRKIDSSSYRLHHSPSRDFKHIFPLFFPIASYNLPKVGNLLFNFSCKRAIRSFKERIALFTNFVKSNLLWSLFLKQQQEQIALVTCFKRAIQEKIALVPFFKTATRAIHIKRGKAGWKEWIWSFLFKTPLLKRVNHS